MPYAHVLISVTDNTKSKSIDQECKMDLSTQQQWVQPVYLVAQMRVEKFIASMFSMAFFRLQ